MSLKFQNLSGFQRTQKEYMKATGKDMEYVLNRANRNIGYKAAQFTEMTDPGVIDADLRKDKKGLKIVTKRLTGRKGKSYTTRKGKVRTVKRVTRKQIALRTRQFFAARKKRRGFLRQGWIAALAAAGIPVRGVKSGTFKGKSKLGSGKQATATNLRAYLGNAVWGRLDGSAATRVKARMLTALNRAQVFVEKDMRTFARDKMQKTAARYSARRKR